MTDTEVTYKFDELSDKAKDKAREAYTGDGYLDYDWWDCTYEDVVRVAAVLGITISERTFKTMSGKTRGEPNIQFSGFGSQGDGASFSGHYRYNPEAIVQIQHYCKDEDLIELAQQLTTMQLTRRLCGWDYFSGRIETDGRYNSIRVSLNESDLDEGDTNDIESEFQQLMQNFCSWIYKQLESQYDWLMSDECVDEYLRDGMEFDEDGDAV